jgi:hypothetical protein
MLTDVLTKKQRARTELEKLVAQFHESGGTVRRQRGHRVAIVCRVGVARVPVGPAMRDLWLRATERPLFNFPRSDRESSRWMMRRIIRWICRLVW